MLAVTWTASIFFLFILFIVFMDRNRNPPVESELKKALLRDIPGCGSRFWAEPNKSKQAAPNNARLTPCWRSHFFHASGSSPEMLVHLT